MSLAFMLPRLKLRRYGRLKNIEEQREDDSRLTEYIEMFYNRSSTKTAG